MLRCPALLALCLAGAIAGESPTFRVTTLKGAKACFNYSRALISWGTKEREKRPAGMVVREGDLLFLPSDMLVPWRESDGEELTFTALDGRVLLGGRVVALHLPPEKAKRAAAWKWLEAAGEKELAHLRCLVVQDMDADRLPLLAKLARANPALGLILNDDVKVPILPLFRPEWCICDAAMLADPDLAPDASLRETRYLALANPKKPSHLDVVARMPALRHLAIPEWRENPPDRLPDSCRRLRALTICGDWGSLSPIAHLEDLEELYLFGDGLEDIGALAGLAQLRALSLSYSEKLTDLSVLKALPELRWLELPPKVTHEQLVEIVEDHPDLEFLSFVACEHIRDLRPLGSLAALRGLVLVDSEARLEPLTKLQSLRFLALDGKYFKNAKELVQAVEEALPETRVVEGGGICLGSGWVLLLVPALAAAWLAGRLRTRRLGANG